MMIFLSPNRSFKSAPTAIVAVTRSDIWTEGEELAPAFEVAMSSPDSTGLGYSYRQAIENGNNYIGIRYMACGKL